MPVLTLFFMPTCPYCRKVFNYLEQANIKVDTKDTSASPESRQSLIDIGGKSQVPCLVIDGKALYESDDIIQWFKDNWQDDWN